MDKSDIAGILGLLIGGAGGYYGGKKRSQREEDKLKMLLGITDEDDTSGENTTAAEVADEDVVDNEATSDTSNAMDSINELVDNFTEQTYNDPRFEAPTPDRTFFEALKEEGEDFLFGNVDYEDLGKVFPVGNADEDFYIPGMQTTSPASNIINRQIANVGTDQDQMITNLAETAGGDTYLRGMPTDADQDFFIPPELIAQDNPNIPNFIEYLGGNEFFTPKGEKLYTDTAESLSNFYNTLLNIPSNIKDFAEYAEIFNQGGRVGLANGGLGYSYKNNIFSADPILTRRVVVDEGDQGVVDDTFINLFPGLFPPIGDPVEKITETPIVPVGGGGDPDRSPIGQGEGFGENPSYGPNSGYDPDDPENSFLDQLGYGFYSNVALPAATFMRQNPFSLTNIIGSVYDAITNPDKGDDKGKPGPTSTDTDVSGGISDKQKQLGGGKGKGFGGDKGVGQDAGTVGGTGGRRGGAGRYM